MINLSPVNNFRYADDTILTAESEEELENLLMKEKKESEKIGFKLNIQKTKIMKSGPITSWEIDGETVGTVADFFGGGGRAPKSLQMVTTAMMSKELIPWKESYDQPRQHIKKQRHYFANKGPSSQGYGLSSSHVWMWKLDYKEIWAPKNGYFWIVVLEKTLESPLDCKEIQPVHSKGDQSWEFIGRTDVEAETPILGHMMWRTDSFEMTLTLGKIKDGRRRGPERMRQLHGITDSMDMSLGELR